MSATPIPDDQPVDLATIAADDLLLDALGRGAEAAPGDPAAELLSAWRADLGSEVPNDAAGFRLAGALVAAEGGGSVPNDGPNPPGRARAPRLRRLAVAVAAAVVTVAGLSVAANHAGPGSPLWPVTEVMYPQQAEVRAAERAIALARAAAAEGRFDDARSLLDEAETHVARVRDPEVAQRLRAEIEAVRRSLPGVSTDPTPPAGPSAPPSSGPAATTTPAPAGGATPGGSSVPDQPAPGLPALPPIESPLLPSPLLPSPLLPLPPLPSLPALPLPSDGILSD